LVGFFFYKIASMSNSK